MKGLLIALQFLTRLPGPRLTVTKDEFAQSMRWFPAAGLVVGLIVVGGAGAGAWIDPWIGAILALILWTGVTGALHLDGLGDVADAAGAAHKDRERLSAILADPHLGSFGVVAIVLQLIVKLVLLHNMVEARAFPALALVPFAARIGPLVWARLLPPLHDGIGAQLGKSIRRIDLLMWTICLLVAAWFVPALIATAPVIILWMLWTRRSMGGISGDGHGAGIEVTESLLLLAILVAGALTEHGIADGGPG